MTCFSVFSIPQESWTFESVLLPSFDSIQKKRLFLLSGPILQTFDKAFENSYLKSVLKQKITMKHLYPSRFCPVFRLWEHSHVNVVFEELPLGIEGKPGLGAWSKRPKKYAAKGHQPVEEKMKEGKFSYSCGLGCARKSLGAQIKEPSMES